jgi:hypothetical protein
MRARRDSCRQVARGKELLSMLMEPPRKCSMGNGHDNDVCGNPHENHYNANAHGNDGHDDDYYHYN